MNIDIIPATLSHVDAIRTIEAASFSHADAWSVASIKEEITHKNSMCFVAILEGNVVGFASLRQILNEGYVFSIVVAQTFRRRGIGAALMSVVEEKARLMFLLGISLDVRAGNTAAIAMYTRLGYEKVGHNKNYYQNPSADGIVMWKSLDSD